MIDCTQCEGGQVKCQGPCKGNPWKAPAMEDIAAEEGCKVCAGSGLMFKSAAHPCQSCKGLGLFLKPKGAETKLVGPVE
jgi:DnaJ-class molecular chaperone